MSLCAGNNFSDPCVVPIGRGAGNNFCIGSDFHSFPMSVPIPYTASFSKFMSLQNELKYLNLDCIQFVNYIREKITGDTLNFVHGINMEHSQLPFKTYFESNLCSQWNKNGFWCFVLELEWEKENVKKYKTQHAWTVSRYGSVIKGMMTHRANNTVLLPCTYFDDMFLHLDYEEWMTQIVKMVRHVHKEGMNEEAVLMYLSLFGVNTDMNEHKRLRLYWKCYPWNDVV